MSVARAGILHFDLKDHNIGQFYNKHLQGFSAVLKLIESHDPNEFNPALLEIRNEVDKALAGHFWHYFEERPITGLNLSRLAWSCCFVNKYVRQFWGYVPLAVNTIRVRKGIYISRFLEAIGSEGRHAVGKIILDIHDQKDAKKL